MPFCLHFFQLNGDLPEGFDYKGREKNFRKKVKNFMEKFAELKIMLIFAIPFALERMENKVL